MHATPSQSFWHSHKLRRLHQKRNTVITYSQPPSPLIRSGRLTGQTMYNSEIWPKIVLFELSLLDRGGGVARAAKGVGTVTSALVKTLEAASCCRNLGRAWEGGSLKSPPQGFLPKSRGPFSPFPTPIPTSSNLKSQGLQGAAGRAIW